MMCREQAVRTPKLSPWERENKFVCSCKGCNDIYSSISAGSFLNIREKIGKARFSANWFYVDNVNLQLKAKHYSAPEAAGVSSHFSRWIKLTERISLGEQCVISVCSEFKAAWSENKGAALLIQASGGSKRMRTCVPFADVDAVVGLCFHKWVKKSPATLPNRKTQTGVFCFFKISDYFCIRSLIKQYLLFI